MAVAMTRSAAIGPGLKFLKTTSEYKRFVKQLLAELASNRVTVSDPISIDECVIESCHEGPSCLSDLA